MMARGSDVNPDMVTDPPAMRRASSADGARCPNPTSVSRNEPHGPMINPGHTHGQGEPFDYGDIKWTNNNPNGH
jgi:hypothetical protein